MTTCEHGIRTAICKECNTLPYFQQQTVQETVKHPHWYNTGKIEVIDFIEDQQLGFHLGNVVKYVCRAGKKSTFGVSIEENTMDDLKKAKWYLNRYIGLMEKVYDTRVS